MEISLARQNTQASTGSSYRLLDDEATVERFDSRFIQLGVLKYKMQSYDEEMKHRFLNSI